MSDIFDPIQAFVDGEPVDPAALERALADPDGRAHLVDILVLRSLVKRSTAAIVSASTAHGGWPWARVIRWMGAAAAIVLVATLVGVGGYVAGERRSGATTPAGPTTAATMAQAAPATGAASPTAGPAAVTPAAAPAPTVVITFKPGVDWTERGGH